MKNEEIVRALRTTESRSKRELLDAAADLIARLTARCARYAEEIAVAQERTRWIPVTERLPEVESWYLVAILDKKLRKTKVEQDLFAIELAERYGHDAGFCKANRWKDREELIAWMPLPEGPEVER